MPDRFARRILDHLRHSSYEPASDDRLRDDLGVAADEHELFDQAIKRLEADGALTRDKHGRASLPSLGDEVVGVFRKNVRGFGFLIPESPVREGDVFIPPGEALDALTGDVVRAEVIRRMRRGEEDVVGSIIEVITRRRSTFTGELDRRGGEWLVHPDGSEIRTPIIVKDAEAKNANLGDKVAVELVIYPEGDLLGEGVITKVLGEAGLPNVETQAIIEAFNLPGDFPPGCMKEAREAAARFEAELDDADNGDGFDPHVRLDLREQFIITIDPPDAKDYDDAISITRTDDGGWELGIHIADVTHFVTPGTALDDEASSRCNSTYLPRLVIPMLPEILSNGICSLAEGVTRFCKSAFLTYDRDGNVKKQGAAATVIKSAKRLTYLEAQALIDGDVAEARKHAKTEPKYSEQLIATLKEMNTCARAIRARRRSQGMIHLDLPEAELRFDELGHVVDVEPEDDAFTHTVIEMFMVEANEVLARLFEDLDVPLIRRIHPEPTPGDVDELRSAAKVSGFTIPKNPTREELQSLLDATAGTPAARPVHMAVLRTLTKAEYSPALIGHFALASTAYAHFTSPIRRYADVTVHRTLAEYLRLTANGHERPKTDEEKVKLGRRLKHDQLVPHVEDLKVVGRQCSAREQNSTEAERELRQFLVLQFLVEHIGATLEGVVTGVTNSGVFIQLDKYLAEGMIKTADLPSSGRPGGRWQMDRRTGALVNTQTGRSFNIGDKLQVVIVEIDLARRQMNLAVADPKGRDEGKKKGPALNEGGGVGGGLNIQLDDIKPRTGKDKRAARSKSRERSKTDYRKEAQGGGRKGKGKKRK